MTQCGIYAMTEILLGNVYLKTESRPAETVAYTQIGGTSYSLADRINLSPTSKDYGVIGDGVTDDTAALQAYINAGLEQGFVVTLNQGIYLVSSTITIDYAKAREGFKIVGSGLRQSIIKSNFDGVALIVKNTGVMINSQLNKDSFYGTLRDFGVDGQHSTGAVLQVGSTDFSDAVNSMDLKLIVNNSSPSVNAVSCELNYVCNSDLFIIANGSGYANGLAACTVRQVQFSRIFGSFSNSSVGLYLTAGYSYGNTITSPDLEVVGTCIKIDVNTATKNTIIGGQYDWWGVNGYALDCTAGNNNTFFNPNFSGGSSGANPNNIAKNSVGINVTGSGSAIGDITLPSLNVTSTLSADVALNVNAPTGFSSILNFSENGKVGYSVRHAGENLIFQKTDSANNVTDCGYLNPTGDFVLNSIAANKLTVSGQHIAYTVWSYADLTAIQNPVDGQTAFIKQGGFTGAFTYSQSDTQTPDGGTVIASANGGNWLRLYSGAIKTSWWGNNSFAATLQHLCDRGNIHIELPAGILNLDGSVVITKNNVRISGKGKGATTLNCSFAAGDVISFGDGVANPNNCLIENVTITSEIAKTSGAGIKFNNGHFLTLRDIRIDANMVFGIEFVGGAQQFGYYANNIEINSGTVQILVGNTNALVQDLFIHDAILGNNTDSGILLKNVSGFQIRDIDIISGNNGLVTYPDAGQTVQAGILDNVLGDTCTGNGYKVITNGGKVADVTINNAWASTSGGDGIVVDQGAGTIDSVTFNTPKVNHCAKTGMLIQNGNNVRINTPNIFANSTEQSGFYSGIVFANGISNFSVQGGKIGDGGVWGSSSKMKAGIEITNSESANFTIIGVDVAGNATAAIIDDSLSTNKLINSNIGYNPIPAKNVTPTGSPFTYANLSGSTATIYLNGGTSVDVNVMGVDLGSVRTVTLPPGYAAIISYTDAPTIVVAGQ